MEILKHKIDKNSICTKLFSDTKWVISFDCDTPNSSSEEGDICIDSERPEPYNQYSNPIEPEERLVLPIQIIEPVQPEEIIEPVQSIEPEHPKHPIESIEPEERLSKPIQPIEPKHLIESEERIKPRKPIETDIKINKIDNKNLSPLEFFKQTLDLYEDDDIIKTKLFDFISNKKISIRYTKKGVSMIMDGITQNKWNIYICKLFSFLLDISFEYRKQEICDTPNSKFIIKK